MPVGEANSMTAIQAVSKTPSVTEPFNGWIVRPIRAVLFADEQAFLWIKKKLGLTEYQMAALVWVKGIVIGLLLGWWLL